ncbi:MAG TPA: BNR-repeat neuraminidase N-terminal domain-containing protein, partial [Chitinophagaceae bacterium]|nr:BNR-repeat neuraminidase N-terminal domain-containing protein [Chitinophagaceae bacterium]
METAMKCRGYLLLFVTLLLFFSGQAVQAQLNYTFSNITSTFVANSGATTLISSNKDESTATGPIGFTFTYNCNTYTQFMVSSNGWMTLGTGMTGATPLNQLTNTSQGPILAPLWDDMKTSSTGKVDYVLSGGAGAHVLSIEWLNMLWDNGAAGPVMSYQVKLYEATGVVEFWYRRDANTINNGSGGASIGITSGTNGIDFWSIDATGLIPTYGRDNNPQITARPAGNRIYRFTPDPTSFVSATTTQANTGSVTRCNPTDQVILGVVVETTGSCNMYSLTQMQLNMTGSTAPTTDVSKVHVYYTGLSSGFAPINEFVAGGTAPAAGNFNVSGSQLLQGGTNYFWIAYDVAPGATVGNVLDGQCLSVTLSGGPGVKVPTVTNPAGSRAIANCSVAPGGVGGMSFWVKGNAGTSSTVNATAISSWNDQSGNGRSASQATAANQPSYRDNSSSNMNFNPVVNFDAASQSSTNGDYMDITANGMLSPGNNPYTVYSVIKPSTGNATTPGKYIFTGIAGQNDFNAFDIRSGGSYNDSWNLNDLIIGSQWTSGYPSLATFNYNTAQREMFIAGGSVGTKVGYDRISPDANNALGCQRSNVPLIEFYDGAIGEIITYANYSHTAAQRNQVETYLGLKYGITLQHDYLSSTGATVWSRSLNAAYNNNIIGLARDDNSALSQKESKSTSTTQDMLTLYMGAAKTTNQASNTGTFAAGDKSFFIVGNNGNPYIYPTGMTNDKPAGICCRLDRIWMAQKTNFTNADLKLEFDFNVVTPGYTTLNTADLRLLVDNDGVFANATVLGSPAIT